MRRMGDRVRISVQLIDAGTGNHVWGERYDRAQAEIFSVQDEVVQTIVSTLVGRVHVSDAERARRKPPANLDAYECMLEGNALHWDDPEGAAEATRLFEHAIEIDPGYGMAYALLGSMKRAKWRDDPTNSNTLLDESYALAMRSVELADNESTCHSLLAQACLARRSFDLALQHMQRAVELNPNNQWNAADMGLVLTYTGQGGGSTGLVRAGPADRPLLRRALVLATEWNRMHGPRPLPGGRRPVRSSPDSRVPRRRMKAGCHARLGDLEQARACAAECLSLRPDFSIRHMMSKEPFKFTADAERVAESLRLAGLPDTPEPAWVGDVLEFWSAKSVAATGFPGARGRCQSGSIPGAV